MKTLLKQQRRLRFEERDQAVMREQPGERRADDGGEEREDPRLSREADELRVARIHRTEGDERHGARQRRERTTILHAPIECAAGVLPAGFIQVSREAAVRARFEDQRREADHREHRAVLGVKCGRHRAHEHDGGGK